MPSSLHILLMSAHQWAFFVGLGAAVRGEHACGGDDPQAPAIDEHIEPKSHDVSQVDVVHPQGRRYARSPLDTIGPWQGDRLPAHRIEDPGVATRCTLVGAGEGRP